MPMPFRIGLPKASSRKISIPSARSDLMLKRIDGPARATVTVTIEGEQAAVPEGVSVSAALLMHGLTFTRTTAISQIPRAPYCLMGVCFECLVVVDGVPNVQG